MRRLISEYRVVRGLSEKVPISDVNELRPDPYSRASHAALVRDLEADG